MALGSGAQSTATATREAEEIQEGVRPVSERLLIGREYRRRVEKAVEFIDQEMRLYEEARDRSMDRSMGEDPGHPPPYLIGLATGLALVKSILQGAEGENES